MQGIVGLYKLRINVGKSVVSIMKFKIFSFESFEQFRILCGVIIVDIMVFGKFKSRLKIKKIVDIFNFFKFLKYIVN